MRGTNDHTELSLDRAVCNDAWFSAWDKVACCTLPRNHSEHFPILLILKNGLSSHPSPFKFHSMWTDHVDCRRLVSEVWKRTFWGCPMYVLSQKPKCLKAELKVWKKQVFGNVHLKVEKAMAKLEFFQDKIDSEVTRICYTLMSLLLKWILIRPYPSKSPFGRKRVSLTGIQKETEIHVFFFHNVTKIRNSVSPISVLKVGNSVLNDQKDIENHVLDFYKELYASDNSCVDNGIIESVIPSLVSLSDNIMLTNIPTLNEVKNIVFGLHRNNALGPDGFGGSFYHTFWDIIGTDVHNSVLQFFKDGWIFPKLNSNRLVLIPKFVGVDRIENFRPIALANFQFKVITKVLAGRIASIVPKIISAEQRGFLRGRHIKDCVFIALEAVNMLHNRHFGGNMALKFDIKKAFDTLDWRFY